MTINTINYNLIFLVEKSFKCNKSLTNEEKKLKKASRRADNKDIGTKRLKGTASYNGHECITSKIFMSDGTQE